MISSPNEARNSWTDFVSLRVICLAGLHWAVETTLLGQQHVCPPGAVASVSLDQVFFPVAAVGLSSTSSNWSTCTGNTLLVGRSQTQIWHLPQDCQSCGQFKVDLEGAVFSAHRLPGNGCSPASCACLHAHLRKVLSHLLCVRQVSFAPSLGHLGQQH